MFKKAIGVPI